MEESKKCLKCGQVLPLTEFYKKARSKDGHQSICKKCARVQSKKYYAAKQSAGTPPPYTPTSTKKYLPSDRPKDPMMAVNPEFNGKKPNELIAAARNIIAELRARGYGYEGRLTYLKEIEL